MSLRFLFMGATRYAARWIPSRRGRRRGAAMALARTGHTVGEHCHLPRKGAPMMPPAVGAGTLRHLGTLGERAGGVLSLYLDLDPTHFPTPAARAMELDALLAQAQRDGAGVDADHVHTLLHDSPELLRGERGLAV